MSPTFPIPSKCRASHAQIPGVAISDKSSFSVHSTNQSACWMLNFKCHCRICHSVFPAECCTTHLVPDKVFVSSLESRPGSFHHRLQSQIWGCDLVFSFPTISRAWFPVRCFNHHHKFKRNNVSLKLMSSHLMSEISFSNMQDYEVSLFQVLLIVPSLKNSSSSQIINTFLCSQLCLTVVDNDCWCFPGDETTHSHSHSITYQCFVTLWCLYETYLAATISICM